MACRGLMGVDITGGGVGGGTKERVVQTPGEIDAGLKHIQNVGATNPSNALTWPLKQQMFGSNDSGTAPKWDGALHGLRTVSPPSAMPVSFPRKLRIIH
eukprot:2291708-Amphidinium_carterae.2